MNSAFHPHPLVWTTDVYRIAVEGGGIHTYPGKDGMLSRVVEQEDVVVWWIGLALAGRAEGVQKLLDTEKIEAAQKKCERLSAFLPETEPELREVCAKAMLHRAAAADTFQGWARFQLDWRGTTSEIAGRYGEAAARLRQLGENSTEDAYRTFLKTYPDTPSSSAARALQVDAALRGVKSADDAKRVARDYPTAEGLPAAIAPWFQDFVEITNTEDGPIATLSPPITLPGAELTTAWAGRSGGEAEPWDDVALRHLEAHNLSPIRARLLLSKGGHFPPCTLPGIEVGLAVSLGSLHTFVPVEVRCGGEEPGLMSVRGEQIVGLSLVPGPALRFAGADGALHVAWGEGDAQVKVPLLGDVGTDIIPLGSVLGQQVGGAYLVYPLAGGMPWYVLDGPPPSAQPMPTGLAGAPVPKGTRLTALDDGELQATKEGSPAWTRTLPSGSVRVLSPLYQEITGLHDGHSAFQRSPSRPLPEGIWPDGAEPVSLESEMLAAARQTLSTFGVQLKRAWQLQLSPDAGLEIPFEGTLAGRPVRGLLDPKKGGSSFRVFLFEAPASRDTPIVFREAAKTHFAWIGTHDGRPAMEVLRIEPRGLVHASIGPK